MNGMRFLRMILEGEEIKNPATRRLSYSNPSPIAHVLRPVEARMWLQPSTEELGTLDADWEEAGFLEPVVGRVSNALHVAGHVLPIMHDFKNDCWYISLDGKVFRAPFAEWLEPTPVWPWRIMPWRDKQALQALLGGIVTLWPFDKTKKQWRPFTEPFRVVAIYAETGAGQYGIGLSPAIEKLVGDVDRPKEWPWRDAQDVEDGLPLTIPKMGTSLRPQLVLWAPASLQSPGINILAMVDGATPTDAKLPVWTPPVNVRYREFRIVLPDDSGSIPPVFDSAPNGVLSATTRRKYPFCKFCEAEGHFNVPVVKKDRCIMHMSKVDAPPGLPPAAVRVPRKTPVTEIARAASPSSNFDFPGLEDGDDA